MEIVRRVHSMRQISREARTRGLRIGFVPTMGYLHRGHLSLVRRVKEQSDVVVVSVFVNPTQFGPGEDFEEYPRDITRDADRCIAAKVEYLFTPEPREMYPEGPGTWVEVTDLSHRFEGASRPGHFRGVCTVVTKLLHVVQPHVVAFGQKDAQQAVIVRKMLRDLLMDVEMIVVPTERDQDGLALSSRNARLTPELRQAAAAIPRALEAARQAVADGERDAEALIAAVRQVIEAEPLLKPDYIALTDPDQLAALTTLDREGLLLLAAHAGDTRLLDNTLLTP